jgi:hypothetical protein
MKDKGLQPPRHRKRRFFAGLCRAVEQTIRKQTFWKGKDIRKKSRVLNKHVAEHWLQRPCSVFCVSCNKVIDDFETCRAIGQSTKT